MKHGGKILVPLLAILGNLTYSTHVKASLTGNLIVEIAGLKNQQGQICFALFAKKDGFPNNRQSAVVAKCIKIVEAKPKLIFNNLKAGNYAVAVFQDSKGLGKLQRNYLGIPKEGFGFSNNPPIVTGPPPFIDSAVFVGGLDRDIQINLIYFLGS